jgi:hypothetical protein
VIFAHAVAIGLALVAAGALLADWHGGKLIPDQRLVAITLLPVILATIGPG